MAALLTVVEVFRGMSTLPQRGLFISQGDKEIVHMLVWKNYDKIL